MSTFAYVKTAPLFLGRQTGPSRRTLVHVLQVESTECEAFLAREGDQALAGCVCARCGGSSLRLTGSRVRRWLRTCKGLASIEVRLARCRTCGARERVLPCDVLPGKVHAVDFVFEAMRLLVSKRSVRAVARQLRTSRALVRAWRHGLGLRMLELFELLRHRALVAPPSAPASTRLVRLAAFWVEAGRATGRLLPSFDPPRGATDVEVTTTAAHHLVRLVQELGGPRRAAHDGAGLFRQAVLLFRTKPADTSISSRAPPPDRAPLDPWPATDPARRRSPSGASP